jgi:hypothetical protein
LIPDRSDHLFGHPRRQPHRRLGHLAPMDAGRHPDQLGEAAEVPGRQVHPPGQGLNVQRLGDSRSIRSRTRRSQVGSPRCWAAAGLVVTWVPPSLVVGVIRPRPHPHRRMGVQSGSTGVQGWPRPGWPSPPGWLGWRSALPARRGRPPAGSNSAPPSPRSRRATNAPSPPPARAPRGACAGWPSAASRSMA